MAAGWWRSTGVLALLTTIAVVECAPPALAGPTISEILEETQKQTQTNDHLTLVWWLPEEYWKVSWESEDTLTEEQQNAFLETVRPYLVLAVVEGTIGPFGGTEFADKDSLRQQVRVIDRNAISYSPLPDEKLSGDVKNLAALLQSLFGNMLGAMGQGMHIFFFPATTAGGAVIAAATEEGKFSVDVGEETFHWRLPISSLLPPKICPEDGEPMSGAWKYCPFHGKKLVGTEDPGKDADKP